MATVHIETSCFAPVPDYQEIGWQAWGGYTLDFCGPVELNAAVSSTGCRYSWVVFDPWGSAPGSTLLIGGWSMRVTSAASALYAEWRWHPQRGAWAQIGDVLQPHDVKTLRSAERALALLRVLPAKLKARGGRQEDSGRYRISAPNGQKDFVSDLAIAIETILDRDGENTRITASAVAPLVGTGMDRKTLRKYLAPDWFDINLSSVVARVRRHRAKRFSTSD